MAFKDIPLVKTGNSQVDGGLERWRDLVQQLAGFKAQTTRALTTDDLKPGSDLEKFIRDVIKRAA